MQEYTKAATAFVEEHPTGVSAVLLTGNVRQKLNHSLHVSYLFDTIIMASQNNTATKTIWGTFKTEITIVEMGFIKVCIILQLLSAECAFSACNVK